MTCNIKEIPWLVDFPDYKLSYYVDSVEQVTESKIYDSFVTYNVKNNLPTHQCYFWDFEIDEDSIPNVLKSFQEKFGFKLLSSSKSASITTKLVKFRLISRYGIMKFDNKNSFWLYSNQEDVLNEWVSYLEEFKGKSDSNKSSFSMAMVNGNDIYFDDLTIDKMEFNELNYAPEVVNQYKNIVENLNSLNSGKLVVMQGPPGTGKTTFIKSLLHDLKDKSKFIFLPTNMLTQLATPNFLPALIRHSQEDKSIVLIIEDADDSLIERGVDNLGVISTLLNMTSGLLGDSLNLRVIATTNMSQKSIDPALKRNGRLFNLIEFEPLDKEQSQKLYENLGGQDTYIGPGILADIYAAANKKVSSNVSVISRKRTVGFF